MALKDWKKTRKNEWAHKKKDINIELIYDDNSDGMLDYPIYLIRVENFGKEQMFDKDFKTEKSAMKFVVGYMRTH